MFSVIIPLYNKEKSCTRAIKSVLQQKYNKLELIIVNDGSTDNSLDYALKAANGDGRARVIQQKNQGVSAARNIGIKAAKNEYIAFLDADDFWHPQYLEIIKNVIEKYPDYLWWGSDYFKGDNTKLERYYKKHTRYILSPNDAVVLDYFKESITRLCINMDSVVMKRSTLLRTGGFPEEIISSEDQELFSKFAMISKLPRVSHKLTYYSANAENRCCTRVNQQRLDIPLIPFVEENIDYLSSVKWHKDDDMYWVTEYVYDRFLLYIWRRYRMGYLSWFSFMKEITKCRKTRESRFFLLFAVLFSLIPRRFYTILGKAWPRNLPHFMTVRTDN